MFDTEAGTNTIKTCPYCQAPLKRGASVVVCDTCQIEHHMECWQENGSCTTFGCKGSPTGNFQTVSSRSVDLSTTSCPMCGEQIPATAIKCMHCKSFVRQPGAIQEVAFATGCADVSAPQQQWQHPPEYPAHFDPNKFAWPAFFFAPLWYLSKNMWQKAILVFAIGMVTYGIGSALIAGFMGYNDYVKYYNTKVQRWW